MENPKTAKLSKIIFSIYLFFVFFGTSMPFQPRKKELEEIGTSNIVNQIVFTALFLFSCICLYPKRKELILFLKREKFLTLFLIWCLLSIFWSDYSFVTFKRYFQIVTSVVVILAVLLNLKSSSDSLFYFKIILLFYIPLSYLSILIIPEAIDSVHFTWRALTVGKNYLGQAAIICIIIWAHATKKGGLYSKLLSYSLVVASIVLLFGSWSMTSMLTFMVLLYLFFLLSIDNIFKPLGVGRTFSVVVLLSSMIIVLAIYFWAYDFILGSFTSVGKTPTFTGRTDLWIDLLYITMDHNLLLGFGFGGFWVIQPENTALMDLYEKYVWLPNEAHLGYLDVVIQTGIVGLVIFALMLFFYFRNLIKLNKLPFGFWMFIAVLILNLQESTFFFPRILTGEMFLFSYLALYADLFKQEYSGTQPVSLKNENQRDDGAD
jgi:exopolysaccharide production protein ExoQ